MIFGTVGFLETVSKGRTAVALLSLLLVGFKIDIIKRFPDFLDTFFQCARDRFNIFLLSFFGTIALTASN